MKDILGNTEEILNSYISGFHQYSLQEPVHLVFVSQNLCDMLGYTEDELLSESADLYAALVHPADAELYSDFINKLISKEQTLTAQYRIILKDGEVKYVSDTATSKRVEDGSLTAYSVLTDVTPIKMENENLCFLNDTISCGFLRYTCGKNPKIIYLNDQMLKIMRFPEDKEGEMDYLEMYKENIYLMIPAEERQRFSRLLERAYTQGSPIAGEMTALRCDGTKLRLYGWISKCVNKQGQEEFQSVCIDVTERFQRKKASETERYLNALTEVYDKIFEYDFLNRTVKCLYGLNSDISKWIENVPMQLEEANDKWIQSSVLEEDRELLSDFFKNYYQQEALGSISRPPQIKYRALSSDGTVKNYAGIFLKIDSSVSLFCCRNVSVEQESCSLRSENVSLRNMNENMQELVMHFTDGIVAFEIEDGLVKPLYASDNVCDFFGYTKEEWILMTQESQSIKMFVSKSGIDYEAFMEIFENGEAEFEYIDVKTQNPHRVKAVCSHMFLGDSARQYIMLYNVNENAQKKAGDETVCARVNIRTFGYFDVFVDEKPIAFRNEKSKELFALLVDRRGGYVSSEEAISFLWEDESANAVTLARYRKVALRLKNILEEYGISDIVESVNGRRRIVTDKVSCDLYDYLKNKDENVKLFNGSYLTNYSWGETTLGELLNKHII